MPICALLDWATDKAVKFLVRRKARDASTPNHAPALQQELGKDVSNRVGGVDSATTAHGGGGNPVLLNNLDVEASCPTVSSVVGILKDNRYQALIRTSILVTLALELHNM